MIGNGSTLIIPETEKFKVFSFILNWTFMKNDGQKSFPFATDGIQ